MAFKDLLFMSATHNEPPPVSAVDTSIAFASALDAKISAVTFEIEFEMPWSPFYKIFPEIPALAVAEQKRSRTNAENLLATFKERATQARVFGESAIERSKISDLPELLLAHARTRDLTILHGPPADQMQQWWTEAIIFGSGRPTVVLPHTTENAGTFELGRVVIAWDFSGPASRAVADALPLLEKAERVDLVTVTNEKVMPARRSILNLEKNLACHGVDVSIETVDAMGRNVAVALSSYIKACNADLLVMGAYGHSRVQEFILGGATKSMLSHPPIPILFSH